MPVIEAALRAPATPLPALLGVDLGNQGYAVVKVVKLLGRDPAGQRRAAQPRPVRPVPWPRPKHWPTTTHCRSASRSRAAVRGWCPWAAAASAASASAN